MHLNWAIIEIIIREEWKISEISFLIVFLVSIIGVTLISELLKVTFLIDTFGFFFILLEKFLINQRLVNLRWQL